MSNSLKSTDTSVLSISEQETPLSQKQLDDMYSMLIDAHDGLSDAESARLNTCLILLLAERCGSPVHLQRAISDALEFAKEPPKSQLHA